MLVFITAGDPSADEHAARLMAALRKRVPDVVFEGFGGPAMELQGLRSVANLRDLAVSGFWEVAKRYGYFRGLMNTCTRILEERKPDLFIPVDYPGFNIRLAAKAKERRIPVAWYIAPQLWAWGKDRARKLSEVVDLLMVVFPFEVEFFDKVGIATKHVGHPLLDQITDLPDASSRDGVLLMPGSRHHEVQSHLPLLAPVASRLLEGGYPVRVPRARSISDEELKPLSDLGVEIVADSREAMGTSAAGLVKAGTSTLEAAVLGLPFSTYYKTSWLTYTLGRRLINVNSITMANLLLGRPVYKEFIQADAVPNKMADDMVDLITNESRRGSLQEASHEVRKILGGPGTAERAADVLVERFDLDKVRT